MAKVLIGNFKGPVGEQGRDGPQGIPGKDGVTPHIDPESGNWYLDTVDTGVHAQGEQGEQGIPGKVQSVWGALPDDTGDAKPAVGGRNYVKGAYAWPNWSGWRTPNYNVYNQLFQVCVVTLPDDKKINEPYTLSVEIEFEDVTASGNMNFRFFSIGNRDGSWDNETTLWPRDFVDITKPPENGIMKFTKTVKLSEGDFSASEIRCFLRVDAWASGRFRHRFTKIEKGVVPTDWSPAPEDLVAQTELSDLKAQIGYTESDIYGLEADFVNNRFTRLAGAVGKTAGADFDSIPCFGGRYRCNIADDGTEVAKFGDEAYSETGFLTQAAGGKEIGTQVQVMVKQPKFYYRTVPLELEPIAGGKGYHANKIRYYVSATPKSGFKLHPAFISNGEEKEYIYLSAYESTFYDVDETQYILDDTANTDESTDKIASIAGAQPYSGKTAARLTRDKARKMAHNRGTGWELSYAATISASQMLMMIEYGGFNTQNLIGSGIVNTTNDSTSNLSQNTGGTSTLGNKSGAAVATGANNVYVSYRGEENLWGNIWTFVDGINVYPYSKNLMYVADHDFADSKSDGSYEDVGFTVCKENGYVKAFGYSDKYDWLFIPSKIGGNSSVPVGDYFWQNNIFTSSFLIALLGATWYHGDNAGGFIWSVNDTPSSSHRNIGARAVFIPTT